MCGYHRRPQTLAEMCRNMGIYNGFGANHTLPRQSDQYDQYVASNREWPLHLRWTISNCLCHDHLTMTHTMNTDQDLTHSIWPKDNFVYAPSQWETTLQCNVVSHWLGAYTKWPLICSAIIFSDLRETQTYWYESSHVNWFHHVTLI